MHAACTYLRMQCMIFFFVLFCENAVSSCGNIDTQYGIDFEWNVHEDQFQFQLSAAQPVSILLALRRDDLSLHDTVLVRMCLVVYVDSK